MRFFGLLTLSMIISFISFGQIYIGAKYTPSTTWLLNKHVSEDLNQKYSLSFGSNYGAVITYQPLKRLAIETNILFSNHFQKYKTDFFIDQVAETNIKSIDIPLLLKFGKKAYLELGPLFSFTTDANYKLENLSKEITDNYRNTNIGGVLGLGANIKITNNIIFNIGGRINATSLKDGGTNAFGDTIEELNDLKNVDYNTTSISAGIYFGLKYQL